MVWRRGRRRSSSGFFSRGGAWGKTRRSSPILVLRGSNRTELGSGMLSTLWVVHLDAQLSSAELWTTRVRAAAGLRSGARLRAACRPFQSWVECAKGSGGDADAHRGAERVGRPGRVDGDVDRRRSGGRARRRGAAVVLRAPGSPRVGAATCCEGVPGVRTR